MIDKVYAVYDKATGAIVNTIVYDGTAEYDETASHGPAAKKALLSKTDSGENVGIGDKYINGKFEKRLEA